MEVVAGSTDDDGCAKEGGTSSLRAFFAFPLFLNVAPLSVGGFAGAISEDACVSATTILVATGATDWTLVFVGLDAVKTTGPALLFLISRRNCGQAEWLAGWGPPQLAHVAGSSRGRGPVPREVLLPAPHAGHASVTAVAGVSKGLAPMTLCRATLAAPRFNCNA